MSENFDDFKQIDRLIEFLSTKGLKGYNNIENHLGIGRGYITKSKQGAGFLSGGLLKNVAIMYPDLNTRWLLTGEGSMHVDAVKQGLMNDVNQTQEIMNLTRQLTKTQQELIDAMKAIERLRGEKDLPAVVSVTKLKPGES